MQFAATWIDLEITILSEVNQKERQILCTTYMWNLKYDTNEFIYKAETDSQTRRTDLWWPRRRGVEEAKTGSLGLADANSSIQNG